MPGLIQEHRSVLHKSGLTDAFIDKSEVYSVLDADEFRRLASLPPGAEANVPALAFPYPGCPGYVRLRPDSSQKRNPGYREPVTHDYSESLEPEYLPGPKYLSPRGLTTRLYIRTDLCPDILDDDKPLWLVEGEKKTLAAIQSGLACIGAPGVTCFGDSAARWLAKGNGRDVRRLHPDLAKVPLQGRDTIICFDSDIDQHETVLRAAAALGQMLVDGDAEVRIAYLEPGPGGSKQGLDDYLASLGDADRLKSKPLVAVEDSVRPFNVVECLDDFLRENWESFNESQKTTELGRLVKMACHIFTGKRDLDKFLKRCSRELGVRPERVEKFVIKVERKSPFDPRVWVAEWLSRHGVTYQCVNSSDRFTMARQSVEPDVLLREMALDSVTYNGPPRQSLDDALFLWTKKARDSALDALRAHMRHRPDLDDSAIRAFARALTGKEDVVDVAVLKHFVWQVKRKLMEKQVDHHLMPILSGAQRAGKSVAVRKLLELVAQFKDEPGDLTIVGDERQAFRFAKSYVMFFDEMAKADRADMAAFKNRISQPDVSWRVLGTHVRQTAPNRATFIGATNSSLQDLIVDPTGIRRFYQLNCVNPVIWDLVNGINYGDLWASVDEDGPAPVIAVLDELAARQEQMRVKDAVEEFLAARCHMGEEWTSASVLFDAFKLFLDYDNHPKAYWTSSKFGRRVTQLLGDDRKRLSNGVKYQVTMVPRTTLCDQADNLTQKTNAKSLVAQA